MKQYTFLYESLHPQQYKFLGCDCNYEQSKIVLFGAPFDSTSSFKSGQKFSPSEMRNLSKWCIESYSEILQDDLKNNPIFDAGDLNLQNISIKQSFQTVYKTVSEISNDRKIPFMIGGNHSVTYPSVLALLKLYPDLCIIHFDAHADLSYSLDGSKYSHGCVMMRCYEKLGQNRIFQFGIRSCSSEEMNFIRSGNVYTEMRDSKTLINKIQEIGNRPVYITVDLDILDPSIFPGTGTPEACGYSYNKLLKSILLCINNCNVIGMDNVELLPSNDKSDNSTAVACKLLREELLSLSRG